MRVAVALGIVALVLLSAAPVGSAVPSGAMTIVHVRDFGNVLTWTPVAAATSYLVYRVIDDGPEEQLAMTTLPFLLDPSAPNAGRVVYSILPVSVVPGVTYGRSDCVTWHGDDISVTISDCASSTPKFDPQR